ncbi:Multiple Epidermal Growth Factor-Like Domains Protein 11 [Manis pentadactyla]|nr:Multiple Epidermal Growth Factor-Like Domains Protein 11 [Manis pentadactyla]
MLEWLRRRPGLRSWQRRRQQQRGAGRDWAAAIALRWQQQWRPGRQQRWQGLSLVQLLQTEACRTERRSDSFLLLNTSLGTTKKTSVYF